MCMLICKTITSVLTAFYCKGMSSNFLLSSCCPCVLKFQIMSRLLVVSLEVCFLLLFSFFLQWTKWSQSEVTEYLFCFGLCQCVSCREGTFSLSALTEGNWFTVSKRAFFESQCTDSLSHHPPEGSLTNGHYRDWSKQLKRGKVWVKAKTSTEWDFIKHFKKTKNNFNCKKSACVWVSHICWWLRVLNIPLC